MRIIRCGKPCNALKYLLNKHNLKARMYICDVVHCFASSTKYTLSSIFTKLKLQITELVYMTHILPMLNWA